MANEFKVRKGLIVNGSGSVILDIQGSQGQLFSVTDQLSGSLFSVNDISGMPILGVSSDDSVRLGTFNREAIIVSGSNARITGSLFGTASWASNATTASNALTSSFVLNAVSASFAATASSVNPLVQNVLVTGSLNISGSQTITLIPTASSIRGTLSVGGAPFNGTTSGFFAGTGSGTTLAINETGSFSGDLISAQVAGSSRFRLSSAGIVTMVGVGPNNGNPNSNGSITFYNGANSSQATILASNANELTTTNPWSHNGVGNFTIRTNTGTILMVSRNATDVSLTTRGASGQTADLLQLQNSSGLVRSHFDATGSLLLGTPSASNGAGILQAQGNIVPAISQSNFTLGTSIYPWAGLVVSGSAIITGSLTAPNITGSLLGTASWALNAISSSFAATASSADNFEIRQNATASNLLVNNTITAQTLVVQTITSSVDFVTGSTRFGTQLTNTHQFTGSVSVTGSLSVNNSPVITEATFTPTSSSISTRVTNLESTASVLTTASASFALVSASYSAFSQSYNTGSFTGSFTGVGNLTGSLFGTASWAQNVTTASFAFTASLTISSSLAANSILLNGTGSSVFATTGSNVFVGNQTVTGSLFTSGSNTLVGSTTLTGSLSITGSTVQTGNNTLIGNTSLSGSLTVSGSQGASTPTINIYGDIEQTGYIRFLPVTTNINTSISASYIFVSGSTQDLYFSQNGKGYSNVTRLRWLEGNLYTGLLNGGLITSQSSTTYQVGSGSGIIVNLNASLNDNPYPTTTYVNWPNLTGNITQFSASFDQTFIAISTAGTLISQSSAFLNGQVDTQIPVGYVAHQDNSTINGTVTEPSLAYGWKQRSNVFINAFGPLKLSGFNLAVSGSSTGSLVVGSGTAFLDGGNYQTDPNNPSYVTATGTSTSRIFRYYESGSDWVYNTNGGVGFGAIDPARYSNNGTLSSVGAGNWSIQRVFFFPTSPLSPKPIVVYYGNAVYATEADAIANIPIEPFTEAPSTSATAIYLGAIVISGNGVFTNTNTFTIYPGGLFRQVGGSGGGGSLVTQTLAGLSDVLISGPTNGQPLVYNNISGKWENSSTLTATLTGNADTATSASFATTASFAQNVVSSSFATTASFVTTAQTASYVLQAVSASFATTASNAATASFVFNAVSASFASTASFVNPLSQSVLVSGSIVLRGNQIISGSLTSYQNASSYTAQVFRNDSYSVTNTFNQNLFGTNVPGLQLSTNTNSGGIRVSSGGSGNIDLSSGVLTVNWNGPVSATPFIISRNGSNRLVVTDDIITNNVLRFSGNGSSALAFSSFGRVEISGSSIVTGSVQITGSLNAPNITGSLFGTASWALNSTTASFVLNAVSASFAATASSADNFEIRQNATASNLLVNNTITAQTLVVQTITSSVDFVTGSTRFGTQLTNTHQFTGSVSITGSLSLNNDPVVTQTPYNTFSSSIALRATNLESTASVLTSASASFAQQSGSNSIRLADLESTASVLTTASASFALVSSSYAEFSQSYNTGSFTGSFTGTLIGTASWALNAISASFATTASNAISASFATTASNAISASFAATASFVPTSSLTGNFFVQGGNSFGTQALLGTNDNQNLAFETSGSTRMFIASNGNIGIGTTTPSNILDVTGVSPTLRIQVANNAQTSTISLSATDGNIRGGMSANISTGEIRMGALGSGGYFPTFYSNAVEAMRIPTSRNVLIATTTDSGFRLDIASAGVSGSFRSVGTSIVSGSFITTGSFTLIGNQTITGSSIATGGYTGSLFGTASWALNATTASFVLNAVSASFASTASSVNPLVQNVQVTGSTNITGSLNVNGNINVVNSNRLYLTIDSSTWVYSPGSNLLNLGINASANSVIKISNGNIQLGSNSTGQGINILDGGYTAINAAGSSSRMLRIESAGSQVHLVLSRVVGNFLEARSSDLATLYTAITSTGGALFSGSVAIGKMSATSQLDILGNTIITGSLTTSGSFTLIGNQTITGSSIATGGYTGSLFGTASWALNAVTSSFVLQAVSASFAATASSADDFLIRQNATASNLLVNNTITAQTLVVQTITSSVDFVTGSTRFGSLLTNTHQFTGSVTITGSLSLNNDPVITQTPYNTFSSSIQSRVTTLEIASASLSTRVTNLESTASVLTTASASFAIVSSSFATTSGSLSTRTTNLESTASVLTTASASFAIVSASYAALSGSFRSGSYTGSFTGTLIGTASWATNAVTASNATTASFVLNAISASFASTASSVNTLVQPVIISGSFTVFTGSAVEFQVTNTGVKIGNVGSDFHTITGSIYQSGSSVAASLRGSGSAVFSVDGTVGRLFQIDDSLSGSLFSVNTAAGLPIIEAFSDNTVRIAQFGQRAFFVSQSVVGIGKESALNGKLDISGSTFITGSLNVSQGITGSLFGTSSWALNAVTSSFVLNAVSASFAATASSVNPLVQNVQITGSTNLTGSLTVNGNSTAINSDLATTGNFTQIFSVNASGISRFFVRATGDALLADRLWLGTLNGNNSISAGTISLRSSQAAGNVFTNFDHNDGTRAIRAYTNSVVTLQETGGRNVLIKTGTDSGFSLDIAAAGVSGSFRSVGTSVVSGSLLTTGSFTLIGNQTITGSSIATGGYTGSLFGTSSWALNATTASFVLQAVSASFAATASSADNFLIRQNATASNLLVNNTITAQTLVVQTITSSVDFVTGSTRFGSLLTNTHQFTGSVTITGSLSVNDSPVVTNATFTPFSSSVSTRVTNLESTASVLTTASASFALVSSSYAALSGSFRSGSFTGSFTGALIGTASWAQNVVSASFAATASSVNTLNQNVIITGSLTVGSGSIGSGENTLIVGPAPSGGTGEGGQILLSAVGGVHTSASMLDNYQNRFRLLRGTNASSDAEIASFNMHTGLIQFNRYTGSGAFPGTPAANLAVDTNGNVLTVALGTTISSSFASTASFVNPLVQNVQITGSLNVSGGITGSLFGTASWAQNVVSASFASTASFVQGYISGSGASGQIAYFGSATNVTSSATFAFTPTSQLLVNNSVTAAGAIARGTNLTPTLTAAANNDTLVGLDINPTFANGAFTGVTNYAARLQNTLLVTANPNNNLGIIVQPNATGNAVFRYIRTATTNFATFEFANGSLASPTAKWGVGLRETNDNDFHFYNHTASKDQLVIKDNTGNVIINNGTTDAGFKLDVFGSTRITNNLTVSGSTLLTGSVQVTGSLTAPNITGSLFGTSSWALNATTASFVLNAVSASFAATASSADNFLIRQNATASNLLVNNIITAQTLVVQTVTSSVVFSSGSNIFGNLPSNVQQFTGSLRVSGSGNHWILGGNVGIGTATPVAPLQVSGSMVIGANANNYQLNVFGNTVSYISLNNTNSGTGASNGFQIGLESTGEVYFLNRQNAFMQFRTNNLDRVRITADGNLGVNNIAPAYRLDVTGDGNFSSNLTATGSIRFPSLSNANQTNVVGYNVSTGQLFYQTTSSLSVTSASYAATSSFATNFTIQNQLIFDQTLTDYASVASSVVGSNNLFTQATGSYTSGFFKYTVSNGANARTGEMLAVWNGANVQFTDNSTLDVGSTTPVTCSVSLVGSDVLFNVQTNTSGWRIKSIGTFM